MKRTIILAAIAAGMLVGCAKESISEQSSIDQLAQNKSMFLADLKKEMAKAVYSEKAIIDPVNVNNFMDDFGAYFKGMMMGVNASEEASPSSTKEEYVSKYTTYLNEHPANFNLLDFASQDSEFYIDLAQIIKASSLNNSASVAVGELKVFENLVSSTSLLTELEKSYLLSYSAVMKYARAQLRNQGMVVGEIVVDIDVIDYGFWDCFESVFMATAETNFAVLADTDSPVLMVGAWVGFPGTAGYSIGDAVYQGVSNCW